MIRAFGLFSVALLLLAVLGCGDRPQEVAAASALESCQWPHGCTVQPEEPLEEAQIEGRAVLPADTFVSGPPSGSELDREMINGRELPFEDQPVGSISAVLDAGDGQFWMAPDSGYGRQDNSSDFLLRMYRVRADFQAERGRSGEISVEEFIQLRDPDRRIPFPITNEETEDRLLTGADFDPESVRRDGSGDLWFGEEYGPFLLHTDATGRMLEPPFPLPSVKAPESPYRRSSEPANLAPSQGFEGMAVSEDGGFIYPMLEGAISIGNFDQRGRFIYEFDVQNKRYTGERWQYRTEEVKNSVTALTRLKEGSQRRMLLIERTSVEMPEEEQWARIYLIDLDDTDSSGFLSKREVYELLNTRGESLLSLDDRRVIIVNDNDYPFTINDTTATIVRLDNLKEQS